MADRSFQTSRPDAIVLIDFPGFNWHIAKCAHARGIPVFYFVPPQLWAWAGWRVRKVRKWVDHVLCTLPFEREWYKQRGVRAEYVGHPYFDELATQHVDEGFLVEQRSRRGRIVAILPGSRSQEVTANLPAFIDAAKSIHAAVPATRFLIASFNEPQRRIAAGAFSDSSLPVELHVGRTPEIIRLADACMSVSGSVGLELLNQALPSVIYYQITLTQSLLARFLLKVRHVSLINLLAGEEIVPELLRTRPDGEAVAKPIIHWLTEDSARLDAQAKMMTVRDGVAEPGACARAADYILQTLQLREPVAALD